MKLKRWTLSIAPFVFAACGGSQGGASMDGVEMPSTAGQAANATQSSAAGQTAGSAGKTGNASGAPSSGAAGNAGGAPGSGAAGSSDGVTSASGSQLVAVAMIMPLMSSTGAAGAAGASSTAGSGGSSGSASTSNGGSAGKAGSAGGTGSGAGLAVVYGQATFTRLASTDVAVKIEVMGCDNGKSYPVHIHAGTSCDSVMSQGGHWGALQKPEPLPMQSATGAAAGGGGSNAGAGGHDAGHAAGSGGSIAAAGSGGSIAAAGSGATTMMLRGEGIPDINCTGTTGTSRGTRDSLDDSLRWTIGTMDESDLLGHVVVIHDGADRIACGKIERKQ